MSIENRKKQTIFWKKHQTLLKLCSELSSKCDAKILVSRIYRLLCMISPLTPPFPQCVIACPNPYSTANDQSVGVDGNTGDLRVSNTNGSAIVFDSFSPEGVVAQRNPIINSISKIHDQSRRFFANFNVNVEGTVSAVLSKSTVDSYCVSDRRAALMYDLSKDGEEATAAPLRKMEPSSTPFDLEIERRKRQCVRLFGDLISKIPDHPVASPADSWSPPSSNSPSPTPQTAPSAQPCKAVPFICKPTSFASALLSKKPDALPTSPFDHIYSRFTSPASSVQPTPSSSYETISLCVVPKRDLLILPNLQPHPRNSNEELAISTLSDLLHSRR